jgi:type III secretory pathway component EscU
VGDILIVERKKSVYLVVNPTMVKTCIRLLPKEVPGSGVTVTQLDYNDMESMMSIPINDGEVVEDMELKRLDKRAR